MKRLIPTALITLILLAGCANTPPEPRQPSDGVRTPINTEYPTELRIRHEEERRG